MAAIRNPAFKAGGAAAAAAVTETGFAEPPTFPEYTAKTTLQQRLELEARFQKTKKSLTTAKATEFHEGWKKARAHYVSAKNIFELFREEYFPKFMGGPAVNGQKSVVDVLEFNKIFFYISIAVSILPMGATFLAATAHHHTLATNPGACLTVSRPCTASEPCYASDFNTSCVGRVELAFFEESSQLDPPVTNGGVCVGLTSTISSLTYARYPRANAEYTILILFYVICSIFAWFEAKEKVRVGIALYLHGTYKAHVGPPTLLERLSGFAQQYLWVILLVVYIPLMYAFNAITETYIIANRADFPFVTNSGTDNYVEACDALPVGSPVYFMYDKVFTSGWLSVIVSAFSFAFVGKKLADLQVQVYNWIDQDRYMDPEDTHICYKDIHLHRQRIVTTAECDDFEYDVTLRFLDEWDAANGGAATSK